MGVLSPRIETLEIWGFQGIFTREGDSPMHGDLMGSMGV